MLTLAADLPGISLALSLHAPNQALRLSIVPSARSYSLPRIIAAMDAFTAASGQRVLIQYCMLGGVNDLPEHAEEMGRLLAGKNATLNLIPWNPVEAGPGAPVAFSAPSPEAVESFAAVTQRLGVMTIVRRKIGADVDGACGQLVIASVARPDGKGPVALQARAGDGDSGARDSPAPAGCSSSAGAGDIEDLGTIAQQIARST